MLRPLPHPFAHGLAACLLASLALAAHAVGFDDIQRTKAQVAIPRWKNAAALARLLHANPPDAATAAQWQLLDAQTDPQVGKAPLEQAAPGTSPAQRSANASWLRWRVLSENADARYSFLYAAQLEQMRDAKGDFDQDAIVFYFHAKLALAIDGTRCTDRSKAEHLTTWYAAQDLSQRLDQKVARMPAADKSAAILEAIAIEDMLGERPAMGWLCPRRASDAETKAPPRFLSDPEWRKYRTDLLEQLTRDAIRNL
jgi:rRNA maturation protein Nop10